MAPGAARASSQMWVNGFGVPSSGSGHRGFRSVQQPPIPPRPDRVTGARAQPQPADNQGEASPIRFSRACSICFDENPRERAAFIKCGHIICYDCAVQHSRQPLFGTTCVFCRKTSGFVKLFEEEASDEPEPDTAVIEENRSLKQLLTECQEEHEKLQKKHRDHCNEYDKLKKRLTKCTCAGRPSYPIQSYEVLMKKYLDVRNEYDQRILDQIGEMELMKKRLEAHHLDECREYEHRIHYQSCEIELMKKRLAKCSCEGKPSVPVEEHQAMVDKCEASLKRQRFQMAEVNRSLENRLVDCTCGEFCGDPL